MDPYRWKIVNRIFHAALEAEPDQQQDLIVSESNGDLEIQAEVQLLLHADARANSFLAYPLVSIGTTRSLPLAPGDIICNRFRILREIAEGGMGHVFEAFDTELDVCVALKVIRPELTSNGEAISRFRQEVRLARSITHPNICRTFDIERAVRTLDGRRTELIFLTMEFLHGETLSARMASSVPIPSNEFLDLARQIAEGLHAAHALGIVHRDLKPANIILVPAESPSKELRAVVTDFGLARLDPLSHSDQHGALTIDGHIIGTLAYMAPEQLEGGKVSPATDIYAFGLILAEMMADKRVSRSNNLFERISRRMRSRPCLDPTLPLGIPLNWKLALEKCLAGRPEDRFQDARDVVVALETGHVRIRQLWKHFARWLRRTHSLQRAVGVSLVLVALFVIGLRLHGRGDASTLSPGTLVYVTKAKNQTGEESLDSVTALLNASLSQSAQVNVLDPGRVGDILQLMTKPANSIIDPTAAREIAMRAGAARVVFLTTTGGRGDYILDVDIQQTDSTPTRYRSHWSKRFTWKTASSADKQTRKIPAELLDTVRLASDWIRREAGESANDIARLNTPPEDVTTNSWDALSEYLRAVTLEHDRKSRDAVEALTRAVHIDPGFALAYGLLGDIQLTLHHEDEGFKAYQTALDPSLERRLSRRERDRIEGMYAVDSWDFVAAVEAFRDYQSFYPTDIVGWLYPVVPLMNLGRTDEAITALKHARDLDPKNVVPQHGLASLYLVNGDLPNAKHAISQIDPAIHTASTTAISGYVAFLEGRFQDAENLFISLTTTSDLRSRSRGHAMLADLAAERGDYATARTTLDQGIHDDAAQGNPAAQASKLADRAWMNAKLGDFNACTSDLETAIAANDSPELMLSVESILGQAIQLAPRDEALRLREQMIRLDHHLPTRNYGMITRILTLRSRAEATLARGDVDAALKLFRELSAIDSLVTPREYLGRALVLSASTQANSSKATMLRREALHAYAATALHPGFVWQNPFSFPPGTYADSLEAYTKLAQSLNDTDLASEQAAARLESLRGNRHSSLRSSPSPLTHANSRRTP